MLAPVLGHPAGRTGGRLVLGVALRVGEPGSDDADLTNGEFAFEVSYEGIVPLEEAALIPAGEAPAPIPQTGGEAAPVGPSALVAALEAEAARLVPLGARRLHLLPADDEDEACLVMQDVEGNEFCLD